jgi:hypothetical protein
LAMYRSMSAPTGSERGQAGGHFQLISQKRGSSSE